MDFTTVVAQAWGMLIWFIPAALLLCLIKSPLPKGHIGELLVRLFAHWPLDKQTYRCLHNVTQKTPDGTMLINHVLLSPYGIFVLETKNASGWILDSEKQAQWMQKLYKCMFKFQYSQRRNYKHLRTLEATLGVNQDRLHSIITFEGGSTFKNEVPTNATEGISFIRHIKSFQQPQSASLTPTPCCKPCKPAAAHRRSTHTVSTFKTSNTVAIRLPISNALNAEAHWLFVLVKQGPMSPNNSGVAQPSRNAKLCRVISTRP